MDTEERREIEEHRRLGKSPTDEGPYYHEAWWESYKGGVKGTLGGIVIGAAAGAAVGGVIGGGLAAAELVEASVAGIGSVVAAVSAFGMLEAVHKFAAVGVVTGAVAAAHEKAEARMKEFEQGKFAELKREIKQLKAAITGRPVPEAELTELKREETATKESAGGHDRKYRTEHCDNHCPQPSEGYVFWDIAAIGAVVGAAAGALVGLGTGEHFISEVVSKSIPALGGHAAQGTAHAVAEGAAHAVSKGTILAVSSGIGAAIGGSFGINRDLFRKVFDVTDRLFKGILPGKEKQLAAAPEVAPALTPCEQKALEEKALPMVVAPEAPEKSNTYFQDKVGTLSARQALLSFEHTNAVRH